MATEDSNNWRGSHAYWSKLASIYSSIARSDPRSFFYVPLAEAQANMNKVKEAIVTLEDGMSARAGSRAAKVFLAKLYYREGKTEKAKGLLEEVLSVKPDITSAVFLLCKIYEKERKYVSAKKITTGLMDYYPDSEVVQSLVRRYKDITEIGSRRNEKLSKTVATVCELSAVDKLETMLDKITKLKECESRQH